MSMFVTFKPVSPNGRERKGLELHVGTSLDPLKDLYSDMHVESVQADGYELEQIRNTFTNIPMSYNRVVQWTGETAQFIWNNLKWQKM